MSAKTNFESLENPLNEAYACLLDNGLDGAVEALRIMVNEASKIERAQYLQAFPHERSTQRVDYANGFKPKTMLTHMSEITKVSPMDFRLRQGNRHTQHAAVS